MWIRFLLLLIIAIPLTLVTVIYLSIENRPLVTKIAQITPAHISRAKHILSLNDPRKIQTETLRTITINQEDLDLVVNYLANNYGKSSASIELQPSTAKIRATIKLPANPIGDYLNIDTIIRETQTLPRVDRLHIGKLPVPTFIANWLLQIGINQLQTSADYGTAAHTIKNMHIRNEMLHVVFKWDGALPNQLKVMLFPPKEQERLKTYHEQLVKLISQSDPKQNLRLHELMQSLFELATRHANHGADPTAENRAAIIVLALYVNRKEFGSIIPAVLQWPKPIFRDVTLGGRNDFPQHFTISAALAATAGSPLSDVIGLYKEIEDSHGGSGFSFSDIAADRAGSHFGELATKSYNDAQKVQRQLTENLRESDIMPEVLDLPEYMQEIEFNRRYGGVGNPAYIKMTNEIERRITTLPLYHR
jgi:hypothetical protein